MNAFCLTPTTDKSIRSALRKDLENIHKKDPGALIIDELGITHGSARIDLAVVNGSIHGYELKSDLDTLDRLPEQMRIYNMVLDHITLVVGKAHLHEAINIVPDWWGITIAKTTKGDSNAIRFYKIREADENPVQDSVALASLLWREEALQILERIQQVDGIRSKPRSVLYHRLASVLDRRTLKKEVRERLSARTGWRAAKQRTPSDG